MEGMAKVLPHIEMHKPSAPPAEEYELIRNAVDHQLRLGLFERLDTNYLHGAVASTPSISGAIFFSLQPKQLTLLIADARISIVLAVQRHLSNEQYRKRLASEFHYRALRPHLSQSFRLLMVPPSHSRSYRIATGRQPSLALAYQGEIDRLEEEYLTRHKSVDVIHRSCVRVRAHGP
jgi:hypothetical protein